MFIQDDKNVWGYKLNTMPLSQMCDFEFYYQRFGTVFPFECLELSTILLEFSLTFKSVFFLLNAFHLSDILPFISKNYT